jgi:hypothetical protein
MPVSALISALAMVDMASGSDDEVRVDIDSRWRTAQSASTSPSCRGKIVRRSSLRMLRAT